MSTDNYDQTLAELREGVRYTTEMVERTNEILQQAIRSRDNAQARLDEWSGVTESDYQAVRTVIDCLEDAIVTGKDGNAYSADLSTRDGALEVLTQSLETTQGFLDKEIGYYAERVANLRTAIAWVQANGVPQAGTPA